MEGYLYLLEKEKLEFPSPSRLGTISHNANEALVLVDAWMPLVRDQEANRSVKKTLTIPKWLNDLAEMNRINFSHTLQSALKKQLGLGKKSKCFGQGNGAALFLELLRMFSYKTWR